MSIRRLFTTEAQLLSINSEYFVINADDRSITPPTDFKNFGVESDENANRVWFKSDRYVGDNLDLSKLNLRVNYQNANGDKDQYIVTDVTVEGDKVRFSWLLSRKATMYSGTLSFIVCAVKTDSNGLITNEWNTTLCTGTVLGGLEVDAPEIPDDVTDLVSQLLDITAQAVSDAETAKAQALAEMETAEAQSISDINEAKDQALEYIGNGVDKTLTVENKAADAKVTGEAVRSKAPAIIVSESGERIVVNDSSDMPLKCLQVYGKTDTKKTSNGYQLFDASRIPNNSMGGVKLTNNGDGSFTLNGALSVPTTELFEAGYDLTHDETLKLLKVGKLYLNCEDSQPWFTVDLERVNPYSNVAYFHLSANSGKIVSADVTQEMLDDVTSYLSFKFFMPKGGYPWNGTVKPMVYQDGTGEFEPYTGGEAVVSPEYPQELISVDSPQVNIYGKNLINVPEIFTFTQYVKVNVNLPAGKYKFNFDSVTYGGDNAPSVRFLKNDAWKLFNDESKDVSINLKTVETELYFYSNGTVYEGSAGIEATINKFMISVDGGEYESYKKQSTVLPYTLNGIPVESGGNYTDADGQQWICDEVDLERGVLIQRVGKYVLTGADSEVWLQESEKELFKLRYLNLTNDWNVTDNIGKSLMSHYSYNADVWNETTTEYGYCINFNSLFIRHKNINTLNEFKEFISVNPITLLYILSDSIEIPLTEEEITAFKALCGNYPVTTILNDKGAYMGVKYAVDTETYINNNFVPLSYYEALEARVKALEGGV